MIKITEDNYKENLKEILRANKDGFWYAEVSKPFVALGSYDKGNKEVAESLGYTCADNVYVRGGTIVLKPNDLVFGIFRYNATGHEERELIKEIALLIGTEINNNDFMLDGKKVGAISTEITFNRKLMIVFFTMTDPNLDDISKICNKKSNKIPGKLTGITKDKIIDFFEKLEA